jgi:hypothetical protein
VVRGSLEARTLEGEERLCLETERAISTHAYEEADKHRMLQYTIPALNPSEARFS